MDVATFKLYRPEFSASTYDDRIGTLIGAAPVLDEDRAGNQLDIAISAWIAWKLFIQDRAIKFGTAGMASSSVSTEDTVGLLTSKSSISQSSGAGAAKSLYEQEWDDYMAQFGAGALVV